LSSFELPSDAVDFLQKGNQFTYDPEECEPGEVKLNNLNQLVLGEIWIDPHLESDPHSGEKGYYSVPAVSLTGECEDYDPEFILLWLPEEKLFGSWDSDHWILIVFIDTTWKEICEQPALYLNAQWDNETPVGSFFEPWHKYEIKKGRPF
jgi:hypothetical protein